MKKHILILNIVLFIIFAYVNVYASVKRIWTVQPGTSSTDGGEDIVVDDLGNVYVTGYTFGGLDGNTNKGSYDIVITKYDKDGNRLWTRQPGTSADDRGRGIVIDTNRNVYVTGRTAGNLDANINKGSDDIFLTKYDTDGKWIWTKLMGTSSSDYSTSIAICKSNDLYITGLTWGSLEGNTNNGGRDIFITKYDTTTDTFVWTKQPGTTESDWPTSIDVDISGNVYVSGFTEGGLDGNTNQGGSDIFITKYDSNGNRIWTKQPGTSENEQGRGLVVDTSGNVYVAGYTVGALDGNTNKGDWDIIITKYDTNGNRIWTKQPGTTARDQADGITLDKYGNLYITGYTAGALDGNTNKGNRDVFISKYDTDGNWIWTEQFGTSTNDQGQGIAVDPRFVYVTGTTLGALHGNTNKGAQDMFITKYEQVLSISGTITDGTDAIANVTVNLTGDVVDDTVTSGTGYFIFNDLPIHATYTITPSYIHCSEITPLNRVYVNIDSNITDADFEGTLNEWTIKGKVEDEIGSPLSGITVELEGDATDSTTTDGLGDFVFNGLKAGRNYNVIPSKEHWSFDPENHFYNDLSENKTNTNFVGTLKKWKISGTVTDGTDPILGVAVILTGDSTANTMTNDLGYYEFTNLNAGATYTITPSYTHFSEIIPQNRTYEDLSADITDANFTGTFNKWAISGTVTDGTDPILGVAVTLTGDSTANTMTNDLGYYEFTNLNAGATYTVTPTMNNYKFEPEYFTYSNLNENKTCDFEGEKSFSEDLEKLKVYPNPCKKDSITFDNLTENAAIQIYSISGSLIKEIETDGIEYEWDLTNAKGEKITSGVYIYHATDKKGNTKIGKFAIIR